MNKSNTIKWRHNYGDNELTYDSVLWLNGKPTNNYICNASGTYYWYINDKEAGMADSLKEAKNCVLEELGLQ